MEEESMHEMLMDISKDTDKILGYMKGNNMSDNSSALSYMMGANANRGYGYESAMWMNNPWIYLVMMSMFGNGGWGNWGNRGYGIQNGIDTNMLMNMVQNSSATNQRDFDRMANNFGVTASQLSMGIGNLNTSIQQVACSVGTSAQQVINAIQAGDAGIMRAVQSACDENRLAICQQTNTLQQGQFQLGVTIERQGEMTRQQQLILAKDAEIRALTNEIGILRDAAQTANLTNTINAGDATILNQLTAIQTQLQNQITAQGYQIQALAGKTSTASA